MWRLTLFTFHLVFGASAYLAGAVGAKSQSTSLIQASSQALWEPPSATGELPTFRPGMAAPSIQVGGGGKGQPHPQKSQDAEKSMSDTVGEMVEKTFEKTIEESIQETTLRDRTTDEPPNPKKRMWEEYTPKKESNQPRDEL